MKNKSEMETMVSMLKEYADLRMEIFRLKAIDKSSTMVTSLITGFLLALAVTFFLVIISIGVSIWLGEMLGSAYLGFFSVAGIYLFIAIIVYVFRKNIIKQPIGNAIIKKALK